MYRSYAIRTTILNSLAALLILSGCATLSKDECVMADWETVGFEDGAAGRNSSYIGEHRKACAKHGVAPDKVAYDIGYEVGILNFCNYGRGRDAALDGYAVNQLCPSQAEYHRGYNDGLENFCSYDSGYDYGLSGRNYRRTCPAQLESTFLQGYNAGNQVFSLQSQFYSLQGQLQSIEAQRQHIKEDQDALKQQLILNHKLTSEQRAQMLLDIDSLREEDDDLEDRKDVLLIQIGDVRAQLRQAGVEI